MESSKGFFRGSIENNSTGFDCQETTMIVSITPWLGDLGGGFKHFLCSSLFGEDSHFDQFF